MFGPIGMPELIIIFIIALIVFGPRKLPELGKSLGKSLAEFRRASNELRHTLEEEVRLEDTRRDLEASLSQAKATTESEQPPIAEPARPERPENPQSLDAPSPAAEPTVATVESPAPAAEPAAAETERSS